MKKTITLSDFRDEFINCNRKDNFSYDGLEILFDYFEEIDENFELDVIAICCDFQEDSIDYFLKNYPQCKNLDDLRDHTTVLEVDDETIIIQVF